MSDITSLVIPKSLITEAQQHKINCSKVARDAIQAELDKVKGQNVSSNPA